jgi:hypothetical protein
MIEFISVFLILSLLYGIRLYILIGSIAFLSDIILASFLGPAIIWTKMYGYVLSKVGITAYYTLYFDDKKPDSTV